MSVVVVFSVSGDDGDGGNTQGEMMMMSLMRLVLGRGSECMYVCMYVCMYMCMHVYAYV